MVRRILHILTVMLAIVLSGCMKWDYSYAEEFNEQGRGLFIINEGNFHYGNATLSYYNPATREVENEVFYRSNAMRLGDVAQSMVVRDGVGWIVVNNSHVIFAIDTDTFREVGRITGLTSPRYIHFLSDEKAYVTQIWDNRIFIVNPKRYEVIGAIECPRMNMESGSTEQMVQVGKYLYVNCWSYQNRILKIDTESDTVVDELEVGVQPNSLVVDCYGKLWTITDGGYLGSPYGEDIPSLYRIDISGERMAIEARYSFAFDDTPSEIKINGAGDTLYWINDDVWLMSVTEESLPARPLLASSGTIYHGLTVDPQSGDVYIADAIDHQQAGKVYRYSKEGERLDEFYVGITPGAFCWK